MIPDEDEDVDARSLSLVDGKVSELTLALWWQLRFFFLTISFHIWHLLPYYFFNTVPFFFLLSHQSSHYMSIFPICNCVPLFLFTIWLLFFRPNSSANIIFSQALCICFIVHPCLCYVSLDLLFPFYFVFLELSNKGGGFLYYPFFRYVSLRWSVHLTIYYLLFNI